MAALWKAVSFEKPNLARQDRICGERPRDTQADTSAPSSSCSISSRASKPPARSSVSSLGTASVLGFVFVGPCFFHIVKSFPLFVIVLRRLSCHLMSKMLATVGRPQSHEEGQRY